MPAGPSVLVIADETARPEFVAADLLSQAEHDTFLQCYNSLALVNNPQMQFEKELKAITRSSKERYCCITSA